MMNRVACTLGQGVRVEIEVSESHFVSANEH